MAINKSLQNKAKTIFNILCLEYPNASIELNFTNPLELLIATILSAQCTDKRVNQVTSQLFKEFKTPKDYSTATLDAIEGIIKPTGFFRQKAKNIKATVTIIIKEHKGIVPNNMDDLVKLPGVGRKTANVILGNAYGIPGLPVDTHVKRISHRLGLTNQSEPEKIEQDLNQLIAKQDWTQFSHTLICHGRNICKARQPQCSNCPLTKLCSHYRKND